MSGICSAHKEFVKGCIRCEAMKNKYPWIVASDRIHRAPYTLKCLRCGEKQIFSMPIRLNVWLAAAKAFDTAHRGCKEKP